MAERLCEFESHLGHLKMTARIDDQFLRSFPFRNPRPIFALGPQFWVGEDNGAVALFR